MCQHYPGSAHTWPGHNSFSNLATLCSTPIWIQGAGKSQIAGEGTFTPSRERGFLGPAESARMSRSGDIAGWLQVNLGMWGSSPANLVESRVAVCSWPLPGPWRVQPQPCLPCCIWHPCSSCCRWATTTISKV